MKSILGISAVVALAGHAMAVTPFNDDFSYANGDLTAVSGGLYVNHSGTGSFIQVNSGAITLNHGSGSREDVNRSLGMAVGSGDVVFFGFDVTMSGSGPATDTYFAHLFENTSIFNARVWVTAPTGGGDYSFGTSDAGSIDATWGSDFTYGSTQRVIVGYDYDAGQIDMWINATSMGDAHITVAGAFMDEVNAIAFRQAGGNTSQTIDNLRVGTTFASVVPTPGAAALVGFAGLAAARRRRSA